jgi:hypothetical protein
MTLDKQKLSIIDWVMNQDDEDNLQLIQNLVENINYDEKSKKMVIGYHANGTEVIKSQFANCIVMSENNIRNGEFMTFEELEKETENW